MCKIVPLCLILIQVIWTQKCVKNDMGPIEMEQCGSKLRVKMIFALCILFWFEKLPV